MYVLTILCYLFGTTTNQPTNMENTTLPRSPGFSSNLCATFEKKTHPGIQPHLFCDNRSKIRKNTKTGWWDFLGGGFKYKKAIAMLGFREGIVFLGGGFKYFLFSSLFGEDEPILTSIFFKWVETTN